MKARLAVAISAVMLGLVTGASAAVADEDEVPGNNDLDLQVSRLESASRADVVGSEASAMLFTDKDSACLARAEELAIDRRRTVTESLFEQGVPVWSPAAVDDLFQSAGTTSEGTRSVTSESEVVPEQGLELWMPIGLGLLLVGASTASVLIRAWGEALDG